MRNYKLTDLRFLAFSIIITISSSFSFGQVFQGSVIEKGTNNPVRYVNIGIPLKNIGTVSNDKGEYQLNVPSGFENDSVKFSCIGFSPIIIKLTELKENQTIYLEKKIYVLDDIVVLPKRTKIKTLGVTSKAKRFKAGFKDNKLGYECGILMRNNKLSKLHALNINIADCTLDSIYYRLNIYKKTGNKQFVNILTESVYIKTKAIASGNITVDLSGFEINVVGNFLVTLEHVKSQQGKMFFCTGIGKTTYYRKTSQGEWETAPIGVSFSVKVETENKTPSND